MTVRRPVGRRRCGDQTTAGRTTVRDPLVPARLVMPGPAARPGLPERTRGYPFGAPYRCATLRSVSGFVRISDRQRVEAIAGSLHADRDHAAAQCRERPQRRPAPTSRGAAVRIWSRTSITCRHQRTKSPAEMSEPPAWAAASDSASGRRRAQARRGGREPGIGRPGRRYPVPPFHPGRARPRPQRSSPGRLPAGRGPDASRRAAPGGTRRPDRRPPRPGPPPVGPARVRRRRHSAISRSLSDQIRRSIRPASVISSPSR